MEVINVHLGGLEYIVHPTHASMVDVAGLNPGYSTDGALQNSLPLGTVAVPVRLAARSPEPVESRVNRVSVGCAAYSKYLSRIRMDFAYGTREWPPCHKANGASLCTSKAVYMSKHGTANSNHLLLYGSGFQHSLLADLADTLNNKVLKSVLPLTIGMS